MPRLLLWVNPATLGLSLSHVCGSHSGTFPGPWLPTSTAPGALVGQTCASLAESPLVWEDELSTGRGGAEPGLPSSQDEVGRWCVHTQLLKRMTM